MIRLSEIKEINHKMKLSKYRVIPKKADMMTNAIVTLVIAFLVVLFIMNFFGNLIHLNKDFASDEIMKMDNVLTALHNDQNTLALPVTIRLGDYRLLLIAYPGAERIRFTYIASDPQNFVLGVPMTYEIVVPPVCDKAKTCVCYCDKTEIGEDGYIKCVENKYSCRSYDYPVLPSEDRFFDKGTIKSEFDGGIIVSRLSEDLGINYRNRFVLQKDNGGKIIMCMRQGEELCV